MGAWALVDTDGKVINTIVWDGPESSPTDFGEGITPVEIKEGDPATVGGTYENGVFSLPPISEADVERQKASDLASNLSLKSYLMDEASQRISVLQDAVDLEMATDSEKSALPEWKKYRVLLSRVDANTSQKLTLPQKPSF